MWNTQPTPCSGTICALAQVFWVDLLTKEEFEAGFGSHTPMYTGQTKCVRYYMNFARGMDMFRSVALQASPAATPDHGSILPPCSCCVNGSQYHESS